VSSAVPERILNYISTRGQAPTLGFEDAALSGLARDGGLYVPAHWPSLSAAQIAALAGLGYADAAFEIMRPFLGPEIDHGAFKASLHAAYNKFAHPATAPLVQIGNNEFVLELFHGPTLAFKDFAMQVLAPVMDGALARRGQRATIVAATSGDTGGAAIEAFRGRETIDIFVLHPHGRVSDVQRRQMTTASEANVHNIALRGTFDDAQSLVKALFNDLAFRDRYSLAAVNSINWARIMAQTVYYFTAAVALGAPHRAVSFCVPTGNFGDIFAGYVAMRMGLPVERLVIATNVNDILVRTLETGRYQPSGVTPTASPSMDIQVASNFERLLFALCDEDAACVRAMMGSLAQSGGFDLSEDALARFRATFCAARVDERTTLETIAGLHAGAGYLADPHTAVGIAAARARRGDRATPMICLATAHPAKFPDAMQAAIGQSIDVPPQRRAMLDNAERFDILDNDIQAVAAYIGARASGLMEV
jgi:threonine synthase